MTPSESVPDYTMITPIFAAYGSVQMLAARADQGYQPFLPFCSERSHSTGEALTTKLQDQSEDRDIWRGPIISGEIWAGS